MTGWILLTAAVVPSPHSNVTLTSPDARLIQYQQAIAFWRHASEDLDRRLAVFESSGALRHTLINLVDESSRRSIVTEAIHVPDDVECRGKGAAEAYMIDAFVSQLGQSDRSAYKVTGRLIVTNYQKSMQSIQPMTVVARMTLNRTYADSRIVGAPVDVWKEVLNSMHTDVDESRGVWLEHVLASRLAAAHALKRLSVQRFKQRPGLKGTSGTDTSTVYGKHRLAEFSGLPLVEAALNSVASWKQV